MQVFKAYFKIIKKRLPSLLIYFIVFVAITMVITAYWAAAHRQISAKPKQNRPL